MNRILWPATAVVLSLLVYRPLLQAQGNSANPPQTHLAGTVTDPTGLPIPRVRVEAVGTGIRLDTQTDSDGYFSFSNPPTATCDLRFEARGFAPLQRACAGGEEKTDHLQVVLKPERVSRTLTVTATRTATSIDQTAADVSVLSHADISSSGAIELDSKLREVPGFALFRRSGSLTANPTSQGVSMRGVGASGPSRAQVMVDGVPINDPFGGWVYWDRVPRESIGSVEVMEGGASDLYGSGAMGGVINVRTRAIDVSHLAIETSYGNRNTPEVSIASALALGRWALGISGDVFHTDGFTLVPDNLRGAADTRAGVDDRPVSVTLERRISERSRLFVNGNYLGEERAAGLAGQTNHTGLRQLAAGWDWQSPAAGSFALRANGGAELFDQNFYVASASRATDFLTNVQRVPVQNIGFSAQWSRSAGVHQTLVAGFEADGVRGASNETKFSAGTPTSAVGAGGRQRTVSLFGEDVLNFRSVWVITAGVRLDRWLNYDSLSTTTPFATGRSLAVLFPDRSEQALSPRLGVLRKLPGGWAVTGSIYRAFRAPTLNELYRSFRLQNILTVSNADLEAEHLTGAEAGATWSSPGNRLSARGVVFWSDITRPIENVTQSVTPTLITRERENLGRTRSRGVSLQLNEDLTHTFRVGAGYQFTNANVISYPGHSALVGLRIPEVPRHEATFQVGYANPGAARRVSRVNMAVQGRAESAAYDDDQNTLRLKPYFTIDALASRRLGSTTEVFIAGENLTNQRYQTALTPIANLGPPILFRAGIRFQLGHRD